MKKFLIRTLSATIYAALFIFCIYSQRLLGGMGILCLIFFMLFVTIGATHEFFKITQLQGATPMRWAGYIVSSIALLSIVGYGYLILSDSDMVEFPIVSKNYVIYDTIYTVSVALLLILCLTFPALLIAQLWRNSQQPFRDVAYTLLPVFYIAIPLALICLTTLMSPHIMFMILILVWINDSFAYMGGSLVGKHKMWPRHSPGKTWEGTAIGVLFTILAAVFIGPLFETNFYILWHQWLVIALICSILGTLGDLVESMLKRSVGLKDSGNIMPGHGGFLDRFDSLLIILPFTFIYLAITILS